MMIYRSVQLPNKTVKYLYRTDGEYILLTPEGYTDLSEITQIIAQAHGLSVSVVKALVKALPVGPFGIWTLDLSPLFAEQPMPEVPEELTEEEVRYATLSQEPESKRGSPDYRSIASDAETNQVR